MNQESPHNATKAANNNYCIDILTRAKQSKVEREIDRGAA